MRCRELWLMIVLALAPALRAGGAEMSVEKAADGAAVRISGCHPGAVELISLGPGRWALVWAEGSPVRLRTVFLAFSDSPPPPPGPGPGPTIPEAARLAREWLAEVPPEARARAPALAEAFAAVAAEIEAGKWTSPEAIILASAERNRAALGEDRNVWMPWFEQLRSYLNRLAEAGKLADPPSHARLFRELAEGLRGAT